MYIYLHQAEDNLFVSPCNKRLMLVDRYVPKTNQLAARPTTILSPCFALDKVKNVWIKYFNFNSMNH